MTLMVWSFQTVRVIFLIKSLFVADWQQFLKILKVEKSLILRAFRGAKSDIKFEFYEETWNQRKTKSEEKGSQRELVSGRKVSWFLMKIRVSREWKLCPKTEWKRLPYDKTITGQRLLSSFRAKVSASEKSKFT